MTTHQVVIKADRHKKLQSGHYLNFGYEGHFQSFGGGGVSAQPYTPLLPNIVN